MQTRQTVPRDALRGPEPRLADIKKKAGNLREKRKRGPGGEEDGGGRIVRKLRFAILVDTLRSVLQQETKVLNDGQWLLNAKTAKEK